MNNLAELLLIIFIIKWIGILLFAFLGIRFLVVLSNLLRSNKLDRCTLADLNESETPMVSILIPARNEEKNLPNLLDDISKSFYNNFEIIIYDDNSTDETLSIIQKYSSKYNYIKYIHGRPLQSGWYGKQHACHQLSVAAKGEYLLFLDADVRIGSRLIERSISTMKRGKLSLLSIFPKQILTNHANLSTIPVMNWILLSLLPLPLVRNCSWSSFSAANGQFMMFLATAYRRHQPHSYFKTSRAEDIQTAKLFKRRREKIATLLGDEDIMCHMYSSYGEASEGFSRNMPFFFGNSNLFQTIFTIFTTITLPWMFISNTVYLTISAVVLVLLIRIMFAVESGYSIGKMILYAPLQHWFFLKVSIVSMFKKKRGKLQWKGREI